MYGSATLLISRQSLYPTRNTGWVNSVLEGLTWLSHSDYRLVSSFNVNSWNCVTAVASHLELPLRLIVPCNSSSDYFRKKNWAEEQFDLKENDVNWDSLIVNDMNAAGANRKRDEVVVGLSRTIFPISIRPDGIMDQICAGAESGGKVIDNRFTVPYESRTERIAYRVEPDRISESIQRFEKDYLIHWTRTSNGAWPQERLIDYYRDIIDSETYPRRAINSLLKIVDERELIASSRHMPANIPTVAFSALKPAEVLPLMRWRSRYRQMSFEPYGIGIRRSAAEAAGVKPVIYYDRVDAMPENVEPWLTQSKGSISDWTAEKEYRCRGNLSLNRFDENDLLLFVRTADEAVIVNEKTGLRTISFLS